MAVQNDYIERIEFFTIYPNKEGGNTLLATLLTRDGYRAVMYSPSVAPLDMALETSAIFEEIRDVREIPICKIETSREIKISGNIWAFYDKHNEKENWFFKIVYLDGPMSKPIVKKEEVEKLFGCCING